MGGYYNTAFFLNRMPRLLTTRIVVSEAKVSCGALPTFEHGQKTNQHSPSLLENLGQRTLSRTGAASMVPAFVQRVAGAVRAGNPSALPQR